MKIVKWPPKQELIFRVCGGVFFLCGLIPFLSYDIAHVTIEAINSRISFMPFMFLGMLVILFPLARKDDDKKN